MKKVTFLGGGSFGTALAILLAGKSYDVNIWDRDTKILDDINLNRRNSKFFQDLSLPENIVAESNIEAAINGSKFIVLSVPSFAIRDVCTKIKSYVKADQIIISTAKGIEDDTNLRLSEVISEVLPNNPAVILSGPTHAEEVSINMPTTIVVSSTRMEYADIVQDLFMTKNFRVYTNDDIIGIEIGGAVKNIIALASGICDGLGFGDNSKAALMTRGMSEIIRIGTRLGGKQETFYGLTGMGDLIVTCTSMHSRNRRAGILIGQGFTANEACDKVGMVVEGVKACEAFYKLKEKLDVYMPITDTLYKLLFTDKDIKAVVMDLMVREKKNEMH